MTKFQLNTINPGNVSSIFLKTEDSNTSSQQVRSEARTAKLQLANRATPALIYFSLNNTNKTTSIEELMISPFLIVFPPKKFKTKQNLRTHFLYKNSLIYGRCEDMIIFQAV